MESNTSVKTVKAGTKLILSSRDCDALLLALRDLEARGVKMVTAPEQVGSTWMATCNDPEDRSELVVVTRMGLQLIVKGPTAALVQERLTNLVASGAKLLAPVTASGKGFMAICDEGSIDAMIHRW